MGYYSKAHYRRVSPPRDTTTPNQASQRVEDRKLREQAHAEMLARFAPLTIDNAAQAIEWQAKRIDDLRAERGITI